MPNYDYKCTDCGRVFEVFQNMTDEPLQECSACNGRLKRLIGAGAGIIFKGSGFYCTDYKNSGAGNPASGAPTNGASAGEAGAAKPDTAAGSAKKDGSDKAEKA
jgi:putative FmdB family regulatory protein